MNTWEPLYRLQNCSILLLFGLHNPASKRNQKSKIKRKLHKKTSNPIANQITKNQKYKI